MMQRKKARGTTMPATEREREKRIQAQYEYWPAPARAVLPIRCEPSSAASIPCCWTPIYRMPQYIQVPCVPSFLHETKHVNDFSKKFYLLGYKINLYTLVILLALLHQTPRNVSKIKPIFVRASAGHTQREIASII
jgi:hypothetical protein